MKMIADLLRAQGFDVATAVGEQMLGTSDEQQLAKAVVLKGCLLTHNRLDFQQLHIRYVETGKLHFGIMLAVRRPVHQVAGNVAVLLNSLTVEEIENQLLYV